MKCNLSNRGMSLIELMVTVAIMAVVLAAMTSMFSYQSRESRALSEKMAAFDLQKLATVALMDGKVCSYLMSNPVQLTFDSTAVSPSNPQPLTPSLPIYSSVQPGPPPVIGAVIAQTGQAASPVSNTLVVSGIQLNVSGPPSPVPPPGPGAIYTGDWIISFDNTKTVRALKPVMVSTLLTVDTTAPTAAKITACQQQTPGAAPICSVVSTGWVTNGTATCPPNTHLTGSSCDMQRGGDGREIQPRTCQPMPATQPNSVFCNEGNTGTCNAHAICCP